MADLQDSIADFLSLNNMFIYAKGTPNSPLEETCDLQKIAAQMAPMRVVISQNFTNVPCEPEEEEEVLEEEAPEMVTCPVRPPLPSNSFLRPASA
jgi:hypothetical protein